MKDQDFLSMLVQLSEAIGKKGEKYVDLLRVLYRDLVNVKSDLEEAKSAFDLFQLLIAPGILKPTDISVLFETIELTGLKYLIEIIKTYKTYPDKVEITRFSPHRQQVVALGKDFSVKNIQKVSQLNEGNFSSPWKLIQHLEDTSVLTENSMSSFVEHLNENKVKEDSDFTQLLVRISDAINKKGEKYVDMLRVLYRDLAEFKEELEDAKSAFDLFQILRVANVLKATDISVLFETIEVTGLRYLEDIIKTYDTYPNEVKITRFSAHRRHLVALGKDFSPKDIQRIGQVYEVPDDLCSNSWKLITFLESEGVVSEGSLSSFLMNLKRVGRSGKSKQPRNKRRLHKDIGEASVLKRPKLDKGIGEASVSKRPKLDKDKPGQSERPQRSRSDEDIIIKGSLMTRQKDLYQNENCMTPAIWHKYHEVDIAEVFTELELLQSKKEEKQKEKSTSTKKEGTPTSLPEALDAIKSKDSCKVLITGKGGMGKTTLLKYIAHQWATDDEHVFADKLLYLINIREIKTEEKFLDMILNKIDSEDIILKNNLSCNSVRRFLVTHDNEIVIMLDGYDELERNAKDPIDLFKKNELQKSTVVITSRPDNTVDLVKYCDVHIEVKGFSPSNIKKYIQHHFHSVSKIEIGNSLIKEFSLDSKYAYCWGDNHPQAFQLCSSPLLLLQICTIWELKRVLPTYLADLFKELICCILNQYLSRAGNKNAIASFERIPDQYISAFLILGECMYEGLKKNILSIDKYDLSKNTNNKDLLNLALKLGFVYEDTPANPGDVKEIYTPPHKLISEALAGLYLSTEIQKGSSKVEYEEIRCNDYLNMTRVFAVGFLGADADKLLKPWLIMTVSNYRSIVQCLGHVKKVYVDDILKKLDKHMSNDMKACTEQMLKSFRSLLNDRDISNMHLFKIMERYMEFSHGYNYSYWCLHIEEAAVSLINRCREMQYQIVVHTLVLTELIDEQWESRRLLECISGWKNEEINLLSAEMNKINFKYNWDFFAFNFQLSSAFLIHFLKYASDLRILRIKSITGTILSAVINDLYSANRKLILQELDIHGTDLNDIDGTLLGKLFKIAPKLEYLNVSKCRLSDSILRTMITECQNSGITVNTLDCRNTSKFTNLKTFPKLSYSDINNCSSAGSINEMTEECGRMIIVMKDCEPVLEGNDLSDVDGKSFVELINIIYKNVDNFSFSDFLTADNLQKLVESVGENITLIWKMVNLRGINLSSISGKTLANLFRISPYRRIIDMRDCSLSGTILSEMLEECRMNHVALAPWMNVKLKGNDLSDIDGKSLVELIRIICEHYHTNKKTFTWSDYSLTAGNIEKLVESASENITLNWRWLNLSGINLSSISGKTLARLFNVFPELKHINMSDCCLSGRIVNEMMEECCRMNVILKDNMLSLKGNDLSDIDVKSLVELVRIIFEDYHTYNNTFIWSDYFLTADNLKKLVESVREENIALNWQRINLSKINLSSISGRTLACLVKISPDLIHIDMSYCSLSGSIVNEIKEECSKMNVTVTIQHDHSQFFIYTLTGSKLFALPSDRPGPPVVRQTTRLLDQKLEKIEIWLPKS